MALVVETGEGLANADSFLSVADADAYHTKFGNASWAGTTDQKEVALRKGTRYLCLKYKLRWLGTRSSKEQALDYPRTNVVDSDGMAIESDEMPQCLLDATAEAALASLSTDMMADITSDSSSGTVLERVKVGPIEIEEQTASAKSTTTIYRKIENYLSPIVVGPNMVERS